MKNILLKISLLGKFAKLLSGLLGISVCFFGCATIFGPSSDEVSIDSEPSGAKVYFSDGNLLGTTPVKIHLDRQLNAASLTFRKEGYQVKTVRMGKGIEGTAFLNLFFILTTVGATSWGIDAATGNMFKYNPKAYVVELEKRESEATQTQNGSPLEYAIQKYRNLNNEIARNHLGDHFEGFCNLNGFKDQNCKKLFNCISKNSRTKNKLFATSNGLEWYRTVQTLF